MTDSELCDAMELLGISPSDIQEVKVAPSHERAVQLLKDLKLKARANFKQAAKFLHPDKTGGDKEATRVFRNLVKVVEDLEATELKIWSGSQTFPLVLFQRDSIAHIRLNL